MSESTTNTANIPDPQDYVTIDQACVQVFPLLISQLEIANQQLADGVDTLISGFTYLAQKMNDIDPESLGAKLSTDIAEKVQRMHRYTDDLIEAGHHVHLTSVKEVTKEQNDQRRWDINRIVIKTLNMQQLASEIRGQAKKIIGELEKDGDELIANGVSDGQDSSLLKTIVELQVEVNKMVIAFQFQDRVFQIISAVINAMKDLQEHLNESRQLHKEEGKEVYVSLSETMQHVERYYISPEQYELKGEKKDDTSDDIELF